MDSIFIESAFILILTIIASYLLRDPISKRQWLGVIIAIFGCLCFFYPLLQIEQFSIHRFTGISLLFLSVFAWIFYTLITKQVIKKITPINGTAYIIVVSSLFLLIIAAKDLYHVDWTRLSTNYWITQVYLGLFSDLIGNIFYFIGVNRVGPAKASVFLFLVPVVGFLLAKILVGETLGPIQLLGSIIMLVGVWQVNQVGKSSLAND